MSKYWSFHFVSHTTAASLAETVDTSAGAEARALNFILNAKVGDTMSVFVQDDTGRGFTAPATTNWISQPQMAIGCTGPMGIKKA